ncbi:MAG: PfkB family carbohydrate kinase [Anaerolineaceae bacterium]
MLSLTTLDKPDYVVIGHITQDITPAGLTPGGTVLYSGLTARAMGMKVGILSSLHPDFELQLPAGVGLQIIPSQVTSRFKNVQTPEGRRQFLYQKAADLGADDVPTAWSSAKLVQLGPVAREVDPAVLSRFPGALKCITPQGWMRDWDDEGAISYRKWQEFDTTLKQADIASFSIEDVQKDEEVVEQMAACVPVLAVTEAQNGARIYWNGDIRRFRAPRVEEVDVTGAGDIFAAVFFIRYYQTRNPWEAARLAIQMASQSIMRRGLHSIPTHAEIQNHKIEIIEEN